MIDQSMRPLTRSTRFEAVKPIFGTENIQRVKRKYTKRKSKLEDPPKEVPREEIFGVENSSSENFEHHILPSKEVYVKVNN